MTILALVLRIWSCLFALLFGLFTAGIALVLLISGSTNFKFTQMPYWQGATALYGLLTIGALGVLGGALATLKGMRPLLLVWTLVVFVLLVYGYFVSPKHFFVFGAAEAKTALYLTIGSLFALAGAFAQYRKPSRA